MSVDATSITLTVLEIVALVAAAISFGRMSQKLDGLTLSFEKMVKDVAGIVGSLADVMGRVRVLEDRDEQQERAQDRKRR